MDHTTKAAVAVEIAEDRSHTAIVAAGRLNGDTVGIEVLRHLDGTVGAVAELLVIRDEITVAAVVIDNHGPAANLLAPLRDHGVKVTEASTGDRAAAHGDFLDRAHDIPPRVRFVEHPALTAAVGAGDQRRLGGAFGWDRRQRGAEIVVAAELAVWGLINMKVVPEPDIF